MLNNLVKNIVNSIIGIRYIFYRYMSCSTQNALHLVLDPGKVYSIIVFVFIVEGSFL